MLIPEETKYTLMELDRTISEFQVRRTIILETLSNVAGVKEKYKIIGQYDEIVDGRELPVEELPEQIVEPVVDRIKKNPLPKTGGK